MTKSTIDQDSVLEILDSPNECQFHETKEYEY